MAVVGTALKTVSMRIRGVGESAEEAGELAATLEQAFNSVGLTLMENEDTLKSTYQIMKELSEVWDELTDIQRAYILELVAGKLLPPYMATYKCEVGYIGRTPEVDNPEERLFMCI